MRGIVSKIDVKRRLLSDCANVLYQLASRLAPAHTAVVAGSG